MPRGDMRRGVPVPIAGQAGESWKEKAERLELEVESLMDLSPAEHAEVFCTGHLEP